MAKILIHKKEKGVIDGKERTLSKAKQYFCADLSKDFHCNEGFIQKADLKKKSAKTNKGYTLQIFDAQFCDEYKRLARGPQIMPLKDIGSIITISGVNNKSKVVDAGTGSGALAIALAHIVKEVHSYDILDLHLKIAEENIKKLNIKNCKIKKHDIRESIPQKNVDLITLDIPDPWLVIKNADKALKSGAWLVSYSPHMQQVIDFCTEIVKHKEFAIIKTIELIEREWEVEERKARPKTDGIGHSGFLTFVRKIE